ncbi:MAG: ATP-binding cassette domain-containing protein [Desulfovibrio sp.]|uniref:ATP-binding cassette domain-containing protein n=1 Tax=Desulfovibrio sp. TaxID=885 RepID=UPI001A6556F8|nr:ATP-binding cassette domain-containing protein [Desulfovibrio sp.]MBD5416710.1 ATP-binding cassette domain-containing protein [Desulfovibrio sp.]
MQQEGLLVSIEGVTCFLPGDPERKHPVLRDICWQVTAGGHCALFGPNGAGKSSLLRLAGGELWPAAGRILWRGAEAMETSPIAGRSLCALVSPAVQEVWQRRAPYMTGLEYIMGAIAGAEFGVAEEACEARACAAAESLGCAELLPRLLPELSQGQLRLVLLAAALAREPALLLLDECLDGLDLGHRRRFTEALEAYAERGTVIMASHRPETVPSWCRGRAWLEAGRLFHEEPVRPAPAERPVVSRPAAAGAAAPPLIQLSGVSVYIDRHKVLHDIDWTLRRGEHWRLTGANGSGKSTLLRLLAGDEFAAAGGTLRRFLPSLGREAETLEEVRRGVRLVSDLSQALYGYPLTGLELVCSGLDNSIGVYRGFSAEEQAEARRLVELFFPEGEGARVAAASIRRLSTGQLRRLFLARALMGGPDVLLLDEPCSGLDEAARERYLSSLERLAASGTGPALVFVSHEAGDAPACCAREARLDAGRLAILA